MTVKELIAELQKLSNQDAEVLVNVRTHTQVYGQAQVSPWWVDHSYGGATIEVTLPEGMSIAKRKGGK